MKLPTTAALIALLSLFGSEARAQDNKTQTLSRAPRAPEASEPKLRAEFRPVPPFSEIDRDSADNFWYDPKLKGGSLVFMKLIRDPKPGEDKDLPLIDAILGNDIRTFPFVLEFFAKLTDYYRHRAEIQAKIEKRIAEKPASKRRFESNYAMTLVYLGDFEKAIEYFDNAKEDGPYGQSGIIVYALANANFRLGRYPDSLKLAQRAHVILAEQGIDARRDTRWQLMLSTLGLYGKDFFKHFDCPDCSIKTIQELFPNDDPARLPFEDVTEKFGIPRWGGYGDTALVDLDNDGWDDLVWTRKFMPPMIFKNLKGQGFEPVPRKNLGNHLNNQLYFYPADYDNDGKTDLVRSCCNFDGPGPTSLWKNLGDFKFKDTAAEAGIAYGEGEGTNICWGDYDLDGNVDLIISNRGFGGPRLYRNKGDGTFEDKTKESGINAPGVDDPKNASEKKGALPNTGMGCAWGDYDHDHNPDLFLQGWGWKKLYHNKGDGTFEDVTKKAGIDDHGARQGYYAFFFDADNDGNMDLLAGQYVSLNEGRFAFAPTCRCSNLLSPTGITEKEWDGATELYHNNGDGTFTNVGRQNKFIPFGIMGYGHGDWNNDGYQDIVFGAGGPYFQQAEPFLFYENKGDGSFTNITPWTTLSLWGKGHSVSFGDYDHDGNLDLALNNGGFEPGDIWPSLLLHNTGSKNHFIEINLKTGPDTNKSAIGARVKVTAGKLKVYQEQASGTGFGVNSLSMHFGLAQNTKIDEIVIEWPNKKHDVTVLKDLTADQSIEVDQTTGRYRQLWVPKPATPGPVGAAK